MEPFNYITRACLSIINNAIKPIEALFYSDLWSLTNQILHCLFLKNNYYSVKYKLLCLYLNSHHTDKHKKTA